MNRPIEQGFDNRAIPEPLRIAAVVPAFNAEAHIGRCIASLRVAGLPPKAIHVVDDGSDDNTVAECRAAGVEPIITGKNAGAATARNIGAAQASSDILFFLDSDVLASPDAVEVILRFFKQNPDISAVFGCYDETPEHPARVSRIRNLLHRHVHLRHDGEAVTFWTGCGAIRRAAFEEVGGFHPDQGMMEDIRLGMDLVRHKHRIRIIPELQGTHLKRWTWRGILRSDLFDRAIPWSRLLISDAANDMPKVLNLDQTGKCSVIAVATSLLGLAVVAISPAVGVALSLFALAMLATLNRQFLFMLWRLRRPLDVVAALPLLWLHYFCGGFGYALVRLGL